MRQYTDIYFVEETVFRTRSEECNDGRGTVGSYPERGTDKTTGTISQCPETEVPVIDDYDVRGIPSNSNLSLGERNGSFTVGLTKDKRKIKQNFVTVLLKIKFSGSIKPS